MIGREELLLGLLKTCQLNSKPIDLCLEKENESKYLFPPHRSISIMLLPLTFPIAVIRTIIKSDIKPI